MRISELFFIALATANSAIAATGDKVLVQVDRAVECERKTQKGDSILVHYRGTLQQGGKQFDASYDRGEPLNFIVGQGMVIKGWDENLLDMCIGEKRTLTIPPEFGYGSQAMGPIPASSTLIFETELVGIEGYEETKPADEKPIVEKPVDEKASESTPFKVIEKIIENAKAGLTSQLAKVTGAAKTLLSDSDGDEQEHNEL